MPEDSRPVAVRPGEAPTIQGPAGGPLSFKVRDEQTGGRMTVIENEIAPGDGPPAHTHEAEDETWVILEGEVRFLLGDTLEDAPAGTFVFVPRGVAHAFQNVGTTPARMIIGFTPSGMEHFFDRFAALEPGSDIPAAFRTLGAEVGMTVVGPPLAVSHPR